jgi:glycosyltransferase involved in cell wall biosynthesis
MLALAKLDRMGSIQRDRGGSMKKPSIACFVTNNFTNDSRVLKECKTLSNNNYVPFVIALHDQGLLQKETISNFPVIRLKLITRSWSKKRIFKCIKYFEWVVRAAWTAKSASIYHCNDLDTLPIGVLFKILSFGKKKVVYDAHEFESNQTPGQSSRSIHLFQLFESILIKFADKIITVSSGIAAAYSKLYDIEAPSLVLNCPLYEEVNKRNLFRLELGIRQDQKIFLYQGGLNTGRGVEILLEAFQKMDSDQSVVVFMGYGPLESEIKLKAQQYKTIYFREAVSPNMLLNYTSSADYGILFYEDNCLNHRYCSPNKMFEYLMAGIPVLVSNLVEMKRLVEEYRVGVVAPENTVEGFLAAVNVSLKLDYEQTLNKVYESRKLFNWELQEKVLISIYTDLKA